MAAGIGASVVFGDESVGLYLKVSARADVAVSFSPRLFLVGRIQLDGELRLFIVSIGAHGTPRRGGARPDVHPRRDLRARRLLLLLRRGMRHGGDRPDASCAASSPDRPQRVAAEPRAGDHRGTGRRPPDRREPGRRGALVRERPAADRGDRLGAGRPVPHRADRVLVADDLHPAADRRPDPAARRMGQAGRQPQGDLRAHLDPAVRRQSAVHRPGRALPRPPGGRTRPRPPPAEPRPSTSRCSPTSR